MNITAKAIFKASQFTSLKNIEASIDNLTKNTNFYIRGEDDKDRVISLEFILDLSVKELFSLPMIDGKFDLNAKLIETKLIRYLPNSIMMNIMFMNEDDIMGKIELDIKNKNWRPNQFASTVCYESKIWYNLFVPVPVAELVDALVSEANDRNIVPVRFRSEAPEADTFELWKRFEFKHKINFLKKEVGFFSV